MNLLLNVELIPYSSNTVNPELTGWLSAVLLGLVAAAVLQLMQSQPFHNSLLSLSTPCLNKHNTFLKYYEVCPRPQSSTHHISFSSLPLVQESSTFLHTTFHPFLFPYDWFRDHFLHDRIPCRQATQHRIAHHHRYFQLGFAIYVTFSSPFLLFNGAKSGSF